MILKTRNNWGAVIQDETILSTDTEITIDSSAANSLGSVASGEEFVPVTVSNGSAMEIMHITALTGNVITVERAKEGTSALVYSQGDVAEARTTAGFFDWFYQKFGAIHAHGTEPGASDDDAIATVQSPSGAGNLTLTASPYDVPSVPRLVTLTSDSDCSGVTFTFIYKDENGDNQTSSDPVTGPNAGTVETSFWVTEISQIAVSGACTGIKVGVSDGLIVLDLDDGDIQTLTLDNNVEIQFANIPDNVESTMKFSITAGGDHAITWDSTFLTEYGIDFPGLSSNIDVLFFIFHGSSTIYVFQAGANMS